MCVLVTIAETYVIQPRSGASTVRILITPPKPDSPSFEVDHQIAVVLAPLHEAMVKIRGAGRFGSDTAVVLLERDRDADRALAASKSVGIQARSQSESPRVTLIGNLDRLNLGQTVMQFVLF